MSELTHVIELFQAAVMEYCNPIFCIPECSSTLSARLAMALHLSKPSTTKTWSHTQPLNQTPSNIQARSSSYEAQPSDQTALRNSIR